MRAPAHLAAAAAPLEQLRAGMEDLIVRPSPRLTPLGVLVTLAVAGWLIAAPTQAQDDGEPDPSFSGDGLLANGNEPYAAWTPRALAVLPNQEVVVVGDLTTSVGMDHLRISVAGDAITTCQAGIPLLADFEGLTALVDRAGRLVVAGRSTFTGAPDQQRGLIGRFTATNPCSFDSGWSDNGWQILDGASFCDGEDCAVVDVAEIPTTNAALYALLSSRVNSLVARLFVVRFRGGDGEVDVTFGVDGYAEVTAPDLGTLSSLGAQLVIDGAERPLVIATRYDPDAALDADPFLFRFTADGERDASFGDDGVEVLNDTSVDGFPAGLALSSNGAVGYGINLDSGSFVTARAAVRMPDGAGDDVILSAKRITGIAAQGDGKFLVLLDETTDDGMEIYRLRWNGTSFNPDPTFGNAGHFPLDVDLGGANWEEGTALVLSTGRPWLAGRADGDSSSGMFAMRLRSGFVFADGFELGSTFFWRR
jgi:hypothetical protein